MSKWSEQMELIGKAWATRTAIRRGLLMTMELVVVLSVFAWTLAGLVDYGRETDWTMKGLLTLMNEINGGERSFSV